MEELFDEIDCEGQLIEEEIVLQVTDARLNNAWIRDQLSPLYKNVLLSQDPFEIIFRDQSKFDRQNPVLGASLEEVHRRTLEDIHQNTPNLDPRITNADDQRKLHTLRNRSQLPQPLDDNYFFNLPLSPWDDLDNIDNNYDWILHHLHLCLFFFNLHNNQVYLPKRNRKICSF